MNQTVDPDQADRSTTTRSGRLFDRGLDFFAAIVAELRDDDWDRPSPCAGWSAKDVLGHVATTVGVAVSVAQDRPPTWPEAARPGDLVRGEPVEFWRGTMLVARDALRAADLTREMDTPLGRTAADDLAVPVIDLYVHAWDLGSTAGVDVEIPDEVIDYAHAHLDPLPEQMLRGPDRAFGPRTRAPAAATRTQRFLAWTGRALPQ